MKEIGGYIELDNFEGNEYHQGALPLNCGRNCLAYLIECRNISKLYIPFFMCSTSKDICEKYRISYEYYNIDDNFCPVFFANLNQNEYIYIVNYYGLIPSSKIVEFQKKWKNIIVDNSQDFFNLPLKGVDTIYSCRKYFGVSDGAYLYTDEKIDRYMEQDISFERMHYILGRYEKSAFEFYDESVKNNRSFADEPLKSMSKLTHNILRIIDYTRIIEIRKKNMCYLDQKLGQINKINLNVLAGTFMYPLLISDGKRIRQSLQERNIYVPVLWPEVLDICNERSLEYNLAQNLLPIPIDQRYDLEDMDYLCNIILEICRGNTRCDSDICLNVNL